MATILLVDDNAVQAATRQAILKRAGYTTTASLSPVWALEQIQNSSTHPDLVITDHIMPEMNGLEFVRQLRRTHPQLPVLVISGLEDAEAEYEGLNILFRLKPLPPDNLLASVQGLVQASSTHLPVR
jgi:CheY-like chemotaxis protein